MRTPDFSHLHRLPFGRLAAGLGVISLLSGTMLSLAPIAAADTIAVTTTADGVPGSLRAAITLANATPGPHQITLSPGNYQLTIAPSGSDDNATGDLNVNTETSISSTGGAAVTSIESTVDDRVIHATANLTISGVTFKEGEAGAGMGGNVFSGGNGATPNLTVIDSVVSGGHATYGGGISADGDLVIQGTTISDNAADPVPGNSSLGGGVLAQGPVSIVDSTFVGNFANLGTGGGLVIAPFKPATYSVTNSTFIGNSAYVGGAIAVANGFSTTFNHITVANNQTTPGVHGAGLSVGSNNTLATVRNSVLVDNFGEGSVPNDCYANGGTIVSGGGNLADDASCAAFTQADDAVGDSGASLGMLEDNGGATRTMLPGPGSTAIDTATCDATVLLDQRGQARPSGLQCDKGAVEVQSDSANTTTTNMTTTTPSSTTPPTTSTITVEPSTTLVAPPTTVAPGTTLVDPPTTLEPSTTLDHPPTTLEPSTTLDHPPTSQPIPTTLAIGSTSTTIIAKVGSDTSTTSNVMPSPAAGSPSLAMTGTDSRGTMLLASVLLSGGLLLLATGLIIEARRRTQSST